MPEPRGTRRPVEHPRPMGHFVRDDRPVETFGEGRVCRRCLCRLSRYNPAAGGLCAPCAGGIWEVPDTRAGGGRCWTAEEESRLRDLRRRGLTIEQIAARMPGRTFNAVKAAACRLRLYRPEAALESGRLGSDPQPAANASAGSRA